MNESMFNFRYLYNCRLYLKISSLQLPQTRYKFISGLAKLGIMQLDQDYTIDTIACNSERQEQAQY